MNRNKKSNSSHSISSNSSNNNNNNNNKITIWTATIMKSNHPNTNYEYQTKAILLYIEMKMKPRMKKSQYTGWAQCMYIYIATTAVSKSPCLTHYKLLISLASLSSALLSVLVSKDNGEWIVLHRTKNRRILCAHYICFNYCCCLLLYCCLETSRKSLSFVDFNFQETLNLASKRDGGINTKTKLNPNWVSYYTCDENNG